MDAPIKTLILLVICLLTSGVSAEELFWPHGSTTYTNKDSWLKLCAENSYDDKKYLIGTDIVACVTKSPDGRIWGLVMSSAVKFSEAELKEMLSSTEMPELPPRNHSRFKCLRLASGWMC